MENMKLSDLTYKKFTCKYDVTDYQVETDDGFVDITAIYETIPYKNIILKQKMDFFLIVPISI